MTTPIKTSWKNSTKIMVGVVFSISRWLETLLGEKFLRPCTVHERTKKNNFCLDCCTSTCTHCFPPHRLHCLLQIRRYVYHDVIRLSDVQKSVDCSLVQANVTHHAPSELVVTCASVALATFNTLLSSALSPARSNTSLP